jgi:hypothetical protein
MNKNQRYDWTPPVLDLCQRLQAAGLQLDSVDDGGEPADIIILQQQDQPSAAKEATDSICAVDSSTLFVICPDGRERALFIVLGNSCEEIVCDCSTGCAAMEKAIEEHSAAWEGIATPIITDAA